MSEKKSFLTEDDLKKFYELRSLESEDEIKKLLSHIKKEYEIRDFPINDFCSPSYTNNHAAYIYIELSYELLGLQKQKNKNVVSQDLKKLRDFIESKIKRIEKNVRSKLIELDANLGNIYYDLYRIFLSLFENKKDKIKFLQIYSKLLESISIFELKLSKNFIPFKNLDIDYFSNELAKEMSFDAKEKYASIFKNLLEPTTYILKSGKEIFGNDPELIKSYIYALSCADDDYPILIMGETGTGKELIARTIHEFSDRRDNKFIALNCAAIPETLFDAEISGITKGAATGVDARLGVFLKASGAYEIKNGKINDQKNKDLLKEGGTVFLDEINSLPLHLQAKILRIIEEQEVKPIGEEEARKFNIKLICATNDKLVNNEKFRQDLYYRISACEIKLPPLRAMKDSIFDLSYFKLNSILKKINYNHEVSISTKAQEKFLNYNWPGNMRELENVLYGALSELRIEGKDEILAEHIKLSDYDPNDEFDKQLAKMKYDELEKRYVEIIWENTNQNKTKFMNFAGFNSRKPVYTLLEKHGLS